MLGIDYIKEVNRERAQETDTYGRTWDLEPAQLCPACGQPDDYSDCNHERLSDREARELGAEL